MTLDLLLSPDLRPFALALAFVLGLVVLEAVLMALGLSMTLDEGGADFEPDFEADIEPGAEIEGDAPAATGGSVLAWLGIGQVPIAIWVAACLTAFGLTGFALQAGAAAAIGTTLAPGIAAILALIPALAVSARFARTLGRLVPGFESTAISERSYGGRRGVITVGTARRGNPAQARFTDGHGNMHFAQVEPLHDTAALPQGTEIAIIRQRDGQLRALALE